MSSWLHDPLVAVLGPSSGDRGDRKNPQKTSELSCPELSAQFWCCVAQGLSEADQAADSVRVGHCPGRPSGPQSAAPGLPLVTLWAAGLNFLGELSHPSRGRERGWCTRQERASGKTAGVSWTNLVALKSRGRVEPWSCQHQLQDQAAFCRKQGHGEGSLGFSTSRVPRPCRPRCSPHFKVPP